MRCNMKLDQLRQQVAALFATAEDKTTIENVAKLNQTIDDVEKEQKELIEKHKELLGSYKDAILHTSYKPTEQGDPAATPTLKSADQIFDEIFLGNK